MKRVAPIVIVLSLVIPQLALASWWNPFTWFTNQNSEKPRNSQDFVISPTPLLNNTVNDVGLEESILFSVISDNTNIRSCASIDCDIIGYYNKGTSIEVKYIIQQGAKNSISSSVWIPLTLKDSKIGYIHISTIESPQVHGRLWGIDKKIVSALANTALISRKLTETVGENSLLSSDDTGVFTLYIKSDNTPIYSCASAECNIFDYTDAGHVINSKTKITLANLPEWVSIDYVDGTKGYIPKSKFSEKLIEATKKVVTPTRVNSYTSQSYSTNQYADEQLKIREEQLKKMNEELQPLNDEWSAVKKAEKEAGCDVLSFITGQQYQTCKSFTDKLSDISRRQSSIQNSYLPNNTVHTTSPTTPTKSNTTCTARNGGTTLDCSTQSSAQQNTTNTQCFWSDGGTVWNCR